MARKKITKSRTERQEIGDGEELLPPSSSFFGFSAFRTFRDRFLCGLLSGTQEERIGIQWKGEFVSKGSSVHHFLDQSSDQIQAWFEAQGLPVYRAGQVRRWIFEKRAASFSAMTDLPAALREQLASEFQIWTTTVTAHHRSGDATEKLLLTLSDGERIECVLLRDDREHCAMCISTQVGCAMHCAFCASGMDGVVRNLTSG